MTRVISTVRIDRDHAAVFDFFTTPKNAPKWHPASVSVAGAVDHSLKVHEEFTEELKGPVGVRGRAAWRVAARDAPKLWRIDLKSSTPDMKMKASVTLRFRSEAGREAELTTKAWRGYAGSALLCIDRCSLAGHR